MARSFFEVLFFIIAEYSYYKAMENNCNKDRRMTKRRQTRLDASQ